MKGVALWLLNMWGFLGDYGGQYEDSIGASSSLVLGRMQEYHPYIIPI